MAVVVADGGQSAGQIGGQTIDYIVNMIVQELAGAPESLVRSKLVLTLREFYSMSTAWRDDVGPYQILAGRDFVELNPVDQQSEVQYVLAAYTVGVNAPNAKANLMVATRKIIGGDINTPNAYFMIKPTTMQLYPMPNVSLGRVLFVYAVLKPTIGAVTLPDMAFSHHLTALLEGTKARMFAMPKRPWSDKEMATACQRIYRREILLWRDFANRGNGPANTPFRFPAFANVPSQQNMGGGTQAGP